MKYLSIILSALAMSITAESSAQKNTTSMQWKEAALLPADNGHATALGVAGAVSGIHNGVLLVAGGANFPAAMPWLGGKKKYHDQAAMYKLQGSKLQLQHGHFKLTAPIAYAACVSTEQGIFYAGGENETGLSNKAYLLHSNHNGKMFCTEVLQALPFAITNAMATAVGSTVYIAGGETAEAATSQFICLNLEAPEAGWQALPALPMPVSNAVLLHHAENGSAYIYLIGGRKKNPGGQSDIYASVYAFDIAAKVWSAKKSLPYSLAAGTGIAYQQNELLLFGGDRGIVYNQTEALIAAINAEQDAAQKQILTEQKNKLQQNHPGFCKDILLYNSDTDTWKIIDQMPMEAPVTTVALAWKDRVLISSGEIKAGVRSPKILLGTIF